MELVNDARLADAIDAADALLDPRGGPWNLQMKHHPAPVLEVQSFAGRIGCQQHPPAAAGELTDYPGPFRGGQAAVQHARSEAGELALQRTQRVAVFGEHDCWLVRPPEEARETAHLAFRCCGSQCKCQDG